VILGDPEENVPSLSDRLDHQDARLAAGDADFQRIEGKVDEVKDRIEKVEGVIDVLGATERQDIRTALSAARVHPRRSTDPPLPPTPLRREEA
jgi:uncharacterized protein YdcH (DUF465 family)